MRCRVDRIEPSGYFPDILRKRSATSTMVIIGNKVTAAFAAHVGDFNGIGGHFMKRGVLASGRSAAASGAAAFLFALTFTLANLPAPARADPGCDQAGQDAGTKCVQQNAAALSSGSMSPDAVTATCTKAGNDAKSQCENEKKRRRARLQDLILTKCSEDYCYLVGNTSSQLACGRMEKDKMKVEGGKWANIRDAELAPIGECPKPVRDDYDARKTGPQPAFRTRPLPAAAASDVTAPPSPTAVMDSILAPFSGDLGPPKGYTPPAQRNMVGAPPRTANTRGQGAAPNTSRGNASADQSDVTGTQCADACSGANASAQACDQCRAQNQPNTSKPNDGSNNNPLSINAKMPDCPKPSGQICGQRPVQGGVQTLWCCAPWTCDSNTLGKCNPPRSNSQ